jgi:hypothetical protein
LRFRRNVGSNIRNKGWDMEIQQHGPQAGVLKSSTSAAPSSPAFIAALDRCEVALTRIPADANVKRLRSPVILVAEAARNDRIAPERLIADLKAMLFRLPHFESRRAIERGDMMHQLITAAINAYYDRADD